jgi:UDP-N-acetylmuramate: L-alanyl-gamma-D-glutamyl-meso-diaminopimelate ligase
VKEQYPNRTLVACLELHTYSSLNAEFLKNMKALNMLIKQLFLFARCSKIKQLEEVTYDQIANALIEKI